MTVSELIVALLAVKEQHGNLDCVVYDGCDPVDWCNVDHVKVEEAYYFSTTGKYSRHQLAVKIT